MKAFIEDWCVVSDNATVPVDVLWKAHSKWADKNGNKSYSKRKFIVELKGACSGIRRERRRIKPDHFFDTYKWSTSLDNDRVSILAGIDLRKAYKTAWDEDEKWSSGPGSGPGYPYSS